MPAHDPLLGALVGQIRIQSRLGAGAMGVVYRGRHEVLGKDVAVKVLGAVRGDKEHARQRFIRECQAAAKVAHANVVQVFEAGLHQGSPYMVMELVVGHSLGALLDELSRKNGHPTGLPPETVARLGTGIALGIHAIHAAGVVHRDIKPDNVMVAADRTPKVADLGLAKEISDPDALRLTGTGMVVGTPLYCAPEAIRNPAEIGPPADIYSLGATLYQMVAGKPPFEGATAYEVMRAHLEDRPRPLREVAPATPARLADLVELCLDKDARRRPSALQVAEALAGGTALKARQRLGWASLLGLAVLALAGGGGTAFWLLRAPAASGPTVPVTGSITVESGEPGLRMRVDDGAWQPLRPEGVTVSPGSHRVEVETARSGPRLRWSGAVEVPASGQAKVHPDLQPTAVPEVRLAMPGAGMLFLAGEAVGLESAASIAWAGTWPLARWEDALWRTRTYEVDEHGVARQVAEGFRDQPDGEARWKSLDADGRPTAPHHVVSWWEAERARAKAGLPEPSGWREQGLRPAQPALRANAGIATAVAERLAGTARLPDRQAALGFAARLRQPVWHLDPRGRPALAGGGTDAVAGSLVLVPAAP
jgi:tRNA A-37 threonylcarbamoyl transferase component Bud32